MSKKRHTFKMDAAAFKGFLAPLVAVASKDGMLPVLCAVRLRGIGGELVGVSTDRFRLVFHRWAPSPTRGRVKVVPKPTVRDFDILVPLASIKQLQAVFKARADELTFTVAGGALTVSNAAGTSMTVKGMDAPTYPNVDSLLAEAREHDPATAAPSFGFSPEFLADVAHFGRGPAVARGPVGDTKPMVFASEDGALVYLLMPRRHYGSDRSTPPCEAAEKHMGDTLAAWAELLGGAK